MDERRIFVSCAPGLEPWLAEELAEITGRPSETIPGGVQFEGDTEALYRVHLWSALGSHVRVRVGRFDARHFSQLAKQAARVDWKRWVAPDVPVQVRASSKRSKLYHTGGVEQRVYEAIDTAVGGLASGEEDPLVVHARIVRDRCELSVDTCGPALHRRGWRQQTAKAPLREDLAHALLRVGGWQPSMALIDPMMGSGTVVIEAARMARRIAPGRDRTFAFERMPGFDAGLWARLVREATVQERPAPTRIIGRDCERGAVEAARGNATRAGVLDGLELRQVELEAESLDGAEMIACNPPYGKRVGRGEGDVKRVWKALADAIARAASVRHIALVVPDRSLLRGTSLRLQPRLLTDHGGIKVEFMTQ